MDTHDQEPRLPVYTIVPCPQCQGTGTLRQITERIAEECDRCGGCGVVKVKKTIIPEVLNIPAQ